MSDVTTIRTRAWDQAIHCFGTAYIFEQRASRLKRSLQALAFLGIVVPGVIGLAFASFGAASPITSTLLAVASSLGLAQFIGSAWSLSAKWDDQYAYALESASANNSLADKYKELAENPPSDMNEARIQFRLLEVENSARMATDLKQSISDDEKRMAMRAALRQFRRACVDCGAVPTSMRPSNCQICGNFKVKRWPS